MRVEGDRCPGFGADFGAGFDRFAVDSSDGVPADGVPATVAPVLVPLSDAVAVIGPPPAKGVANHTDGIEARPWLGGGNPSHLIGVRALQDQSIVSVRAPSPSERGQPVIKLGAHVCGYERRIW